MRRKRLSGFFTLVLGLALYGAGPAAAWEFSMEGAFSTTYEYYAQSGPNGFFGPFNVDESAGVGGLAAGDFASFNSWVGGQVDHVVSGADASRQYFNFDLFPQIRINKAIRFRGQYRLGDYGDPDASDYLANTRPGTDVATSDGQWTMWWVTAQTPWGIIALGKRPQSFGTGLHYNEGNNTTDAVALISGYGPLRFSYAFRPYWQQPPNPQAGQGDFPYYNIYDKNGLRRLANRFFVTYRSGPMDMGAIYMWLKWRAGPESQRSTADRDAFTPYDEDFRHGTAYVKYNNGRFFFNAESAFLERMTKRLGAGPLYVESWRYMTEFGAYWGPAKFTLFYSFMPGPDRRRGRRIDKQPFHQMPPLGTHDMHRPYNYLLGYAYGGGVNAFDLNGNGYINDASVFAARLDYAVAANLNLFGSFLWAERTSHGYGWGFIRPGQVAEGVIEVAGGVPALGVEWSPTVVYRPNGGRNPAPSIPDQNLGWEANIGLDWSLLDGYIFHAAFAYWQPGDWFKYACIDRSVPNWDTPGAGNNWGANPDRSLDAVYGADISLSAEF